MTKELERILPLVQKPARYTGGEYRAVVKDKETVDFRFALCFPDTYEIGMSNLGVRILYGVMNRMEGVWCERAFAPWGDMEEQMRAHNIPLWGLESGDPLQEFDIIGFSLGYEMAYTNVLNMMDLAGLEVRRENRLDTWPLIVAGGTCCYNPEPLADFVDVFSLGEGEDVTVEMINVCRRGKKENWSKNRLLQELSKVPGLYIPSMVDVTYGEDGTIAALTPSEGVELPILKRVVSDMNTSYFPTDTIVPSTEVVHDRVTLELFRGCIRGCRFCQAGYAYRPVRAKDPKVALEQGIAACKDSGYQEMTLSSLSTSDYRPLVELCDGLLDYCKPRDIGLSLPSLRADNFSMSLMQRMQEVRKSGLTFAPEAGTQRLRDAINKNVTEEDLMQSCRTAFSGGWTSVKLYFMLGLPTETDEDVLGIAELAKKVVQCGKAYAANPRRVHVTVSTACFVPKPHTAFQWEAQVDMDEYMRRVTLLRENMRDRSISYNWHDPDTSFLEAVFSRGDRRLGRAIEEAWRRGAKFDSWSEYFDLNRWLETFQDCGIDPHFYANRVRKDDEAFPWDVTSTGVTRAFLARERKQAYAAVITPDCRHQCSGCGANRFCKGGVCDA